MVAHLRKKMRPARKMSEYRIETIVQRIQKVYLAFAILGVFGTVSYIFRQADFLKILEASFFVLVDGSIYFALRSRKSWVIPLVLITSAFSCIRLLIFFFQPAEDIRTILIKIFAGLFFFFFAYQINFFRKSEVRLFFGSHGHELF
jgi:hypothetical protein